jgi:hypothetical protein
MKEERMPTWLWVLIAVAALAIVAAIVWRALAMRRTRELQERFGPEYQRTTDALGSKRDAESELAARRERRQQLNIRPLAAEARQRYAAQWEAVQAQFVDSPAAAVSAADGLVNSVMAERGYPMDDFDQRAADISVDHPQVVENYRQAREISRASKDGKASTESQRKAMQNYRALFDELLGDEAADAPMGRERSQEQVEDARTTTTTRGSAH